MSIKKMIHGIKKMNNPEHLKAGLDMRKHIDEIQKMGWEKFWKMNNKFIKLLLTVIAIVTVVGIIRNNIVDIMQAKNEYAIYYFIFTTALFSAITFYVLHFYLTIGLKMDFNTDNFTRVKMTKMKGIDWSSAEAPYMKKKE